MAPGAAGLVWVDPALADVAQRRTSLADRLGALHGSTMTPSNGETSAAPTAEGELEHSSDPTIPPRRVVDGVETIEGKDLTLHFDGNRCIHARFCVLGAPDVFVGNVKGPWIRPDAVDVEELVEIAHRCPSGAITYDRKDGRPDETPPKVNTAHIRENGPLAIRAAIHLEGQAPLTRATLCRCGASKTKPFCDGSHHDADFEATGEPATGEVTPLEARDGQLEIRPLKDGPLAVKGNLEICAGTGRTVAKITKGALCRCGASKNKPFCDGTHRTIGFTAD